VWSQTVSWARAPRPSVRPTPRVAALNRPRSSMFHGKHRTHSGSSVGASPGADRLHRMCIADRADRNAYPSAGPRFRYQLSMRVAPPADHEVSSSEAFCSQLSERSSRRGTDLAAVTIDGRDPRLQTLQLSWGQAHDAWVADPTLAPVPAVVWRSVPVSSPPWPPVLDRSGTSAASRRWQGNEPGSVDLSGRHSYGSAA
jgi:hypothetical protein